MEITETTTAETITDSNVIEVETIIVEAGAAGETEIEMIGEEEGDVVVETTTTTITTTIAETTDVMAGDEEAIEGTVKALPLTVLPIEMTTTTTVETVVDATMKMTGELHEEEEEAEDAVQEAEVVVSLGIEEIETKWNKKKITCLPLHKAKTVDVVEVGEEAVVDQEDPTSECALIMAHKKEARTKVNTTTRAMITAMEATTTDPTTIRLTNPTTIPVDAEEAVDGTEAATEVEAVLEVAEHQQLLVLGAKKAHQHLLLQLMEKAPRNKTAEVTTQQVAVT